MNARSADYAFESFIRQEEDNRKDCDASTALLAEEEQPR
jgi:hypothetical protein